jgi:hypothetical protein
MPLFKVTFISRWKSSMKGGKSTSARGWKRQKILVVLFDGVASVLGTNACIAQAYSPT